MLKRRLPHEVEKGTPKTYQKPLRKKSQKRRKRSRLEKEKSQSCCSKEKNCSERSRCKQQLPDACDAKSKLVQKFIVERK